MQLVLGVVGVWAGADLGPVIQPDPLRLLSDQGVGELDKQYPGSLDVDIQHGGLVAGAVPAKDVHVRVGEDLLEMLLPHLVVLEVDHHGLTGGELVVQRQLEAVHQLDVSAVLFADEGPEHGTRLSVLHTPSQNTDKCKKYCI